MLVYNYFIGFLQKKKKKNTIDSFSFLCSIMNLKLLLFFSAMIEIIFSNR